MLVMMSEGRLCVRVTVVCNELIPLGFYHLIKGERGNQEEMMMGNQRQGVFSEEGERCMRPLPFRWTSVRPSQ
jgi:hypothetical protein